MREAVKRGVFMLALTLTACGEPTGPDGPVNSASFELELERLLAAQLCRRAFECRESLPTSVYARFGRYPDQESCVSGFISDPANRDFDFYTLGAGEGRLTIDLERADACLDALEAFSETLDVCDTPGLFEVPECAEAITGVVPVGEYCTQDFECVEGSRCEYGCGEGMVSTTPSGYAFGCYDVCSDAGACRDGFTCDATSICLPNDAAARPPLPLEGCYGQCVAKSGSCGDGPACADDQFCRRDSESGVRSCQSKLDEGDACTSDDDCTLSSGRVECLVVESEGSDGVCTRKRSVPEGAACQTFADFCAPGLRCDLMTNTCAAKPAQEWLGLGEPCEETRPRCRPGLVCKAPDLSMGSNQAECVEPRGFGESCFSILECVGGSMCLRTSVSLRGECATRRFDGQPCNTELDCSSGRCVNGTCAPAEVCVVP